MKHLKNLILAVICVFLSSLSAHAQSKVAHINTQELVESMPEMMSAKSDLEKLAKPISNSGYGMYLLRLIDD